MFYKPKFCCNCGEKIERADWRLWTSRRFCSVCEVEQKGHELLPRLIVAAAVLFGIFGIGSYFQGQDNAAGQSGMAMPGGSGSIRAVVMEPKQLALKAVPDSFGREIERDGLGSVTPPPRASASDEQTSVRSIASDEPIHFCGALTKKGRPCSRRVKSDVRCWQHAGRSSAAAARKAPDLF